MSGFVRRRGSAQEIFGMRTFALAFAASAVLLSGTASAHFKMVMPPSPTASVDGKGAPPCGPDTGEGTVTPVTGGTMIPLSVNENVRHGGFYRVALALKSCKTAGCFPDDNKVYDKANKLLNPTGPGDSDHADIDPAPKFRSWPTACSSTRKMRTEPGRRTRA